MKVYCQQTMQHTQNASGWIFRENLLNYYVVAIDNFSDTESLVQHICSGWLITWLTVAAHAYMLMRIPPVVRKFK